MNASSRHLYTHSFAHQIICTPTHLLIKSSVHPLICSSNHLYTHSFAHQIICTPTHLLIKSSVHPLICSSNHLYSHSFAHQIICTATHLLIKSSVHPLICSSNHLYIHSFAHQIICTSTHLLIKSSLIKSSVQPLICSSNHLYIHSFAHQIIPHQIICTPTHLLINLISPTLVHLVTFPPALLPIHMNVCIHQPIHPPIYIYIHPFIYDSDWCNKSHDVCYPVCGMVHIKETFYMTERVAHVVVAACFISLSEFPFTICPMPYKIIKNVVSMSLNKTYPYFLIFIYRDIHVSIAYLSCQMCRILFMLL